MPHTLLFLFRIALSVWVFLCFHMNVRIFPNPVKNVIVISMEFHWTCRSLSVKFPFHCINFTHPRTLGVLPVFTVFINFLLQSFILFIVDIYLSSGKLLLSTFCSYCEWDCFPDFFLYMFIIGTWRRNVALNGDFVSCTFAESVYHIYGFLVGDFSVL
jgi:hypothetical protein